LVTVEISEKVATVIIVVSNYFSKQQHLLIVNMRQKITKLRDSPLIISLN